jgi:hypothetical protein
VDNALIADAKRPAAMLFAETQLFQRLPASDRVLLSQLLRGADKVSEARARLPARRPAETATGVAGAAAAVLVFTTGISDETAAVLVAVVAALPAIISGVVSATRSTAAGALLVGLTPEVASLAKSALTTAASDSDLTKKTRALKDVTESMASWTEVLSAEPGTKAASKAAAD